MELISGGFLQFYGKEIQTVVFFGYFSKLYVKKTMIIFNTIDEVNLSKPVATIGFFDGVHLGHQHILKSLIERAKEEKTKSLVITFWPHPRIVLGQEAEKLQLLSSIHEKLAVFKEIGVDAVLVMEFNQELAQERAVDFLRNRLINTIGISTLVMGYNHSFGYRGEGNFQLVQQYQKEFGYSAIQINAIDVGGEHVSSTKIRKALSIGDLQRANTMLGRYFSISGTIEGGQQIGRSIGFPTANIKPDEPRIQLPMVGVYAVWVEYKEQRYPAMLNLGTRPTVGENLKLTVEAHIIGFNQNIYDEQIKVCFVQRIRDELKFPSLEALKEQIEQDKHDVMLILK